MSSADARRSALRRFMESRDLKPTPWSESAGIPESTLRSFLTGRSSALRHDTLEKLARAAGASIAELIGETPTVTRRQLTAIKRLAVRSELDGRVVVIDGGGDPIYWPNSWVERFLGGLAENGRYLDIIGDSLVEGLREGDVTCLDLTRVHPNRDPGIYCLYDGSDLIVRRLQGVRGSDALRMLSDNARYNSIDFDAKQVQIVGRLVWRAGAL